MTEINCENIMKEIGPITGMIGTEIGITCKIIMKETGHIVEIDCETTIEMTIGKKIIGISKIRDIREIIGKTGHIAETGNTSGISHIVEIGHEAINTKYDYRNYYEDDYRNDHRNDYKKAYK